jgi:CDP-diacylglycerol---glycerol-3-phosphate 3-phosphatidyltransferase
MLDGRTRAKVARALDPIGRILVHIGISADVLTVLGLAVSGATAALIATGHLGWAVVGVVAAGFVDLLDGSVARISGRSSPRGAFFDSVADRLSDGLMLGGLAWYFIGTTRPYLSVLAFAVVVASLVVSYERARAESLGYNARGGLMERAERMALLGVGLAFSSLLVPVLWVMLALTGFTIVHRFVKVWRQASLPVGVDRPPARLRIRSTRDLSEWWESRPATRRRRERRARRTTRPRA